DRRRAARPGGQGPQRDRGISRPKIRGPRGASLMSAAPPKLLVVGLQAGYGDVQVLWDVSLAVGAGELVCIIGSNGAGKTTRMRCLSGLLAPSAGEIVVDGRAIGPAHVSARWTPVRR